MIGWFNYVVIVVLDIEVVIVVYCDMFGVDVLVKEE